MRGLKKIRGPRFFLLFMMFFGLGYVALADSPATTLTADVVQENLDYTWTLIAAAMVFFMQAGFAMLEIGFTRVKNAGNAVMKNAMDFCVGMLVYSAVGYAFMFGTGGVIGSSNFFLDGLTGWDWTFFLFQAMFAATAATIMAGAIAERTKFSSYLVASIVLTAIIYPLYGHWVWATGGWLKNLGFTDFAGSAVVHSVGGWFALAGAIMVGPRIGKFVGKKASAIPGHNIPMAALGVFILFFGWFGFNSGSVTKGIAEIGPIAVNTCIAGSAGGVAAMFLSYYIFKKMDIGMTLNGILAGLVAVTAGCATMPTWAAFVVGLIGGVLVVYSVLFFDKIGVDDAVGAVSVHGVNGTWGTLAAGIFFSGSMFDLHIIGIQILGSLVAFAMGFGGGLIVLYVIKKTMGLRVTREEELEGLDMAEHGSVAYPEFQPKSELSIILNEKK